MSLASKVDETVMMVESHRAYLFGVIFAALTFGFVVGNAIATQDSLAGQKTALVSQCKKDERVVHKKAVAKGREQAIREIFSSVP